MFVVFNLMTLFSNPLSVASILGITTGAMVPVLVVSNLWMGRKERMQAPESR
jgi:ABC-type Fe3+-siderophore transport system permease subunit